MIGNLLYSKSATITCILAETHRQAGEWESILVECPDWRLLAERSWKRAN